MKGQLGDGAQTDNAFKAVAVTGLTDVAQISAGTEHTCAVRTDKTAVCWGANEFGQLGTGNTTTATEYEGVSDLSNVARVAAGSQHTCAQLTDGSVRCWGNNKYGAIGQGTFTLSEPLRKQVIPACR